MRGGRPARRWHEGIVSGIGRRTPDRRAEAQSSRVSGFLHRANRSGSAHLAELRAARDDLRHRPAEVSVHRLRRLENAMRFALMIEPQQGSSYAEQLDLARLAERLGFEAFFRSDHYRSFPGADDQPTTDAWTVLAGIARETSQIRLGRPRLTDYLPPSGILRQGLDHGRRDERRPDRGRRGSGLERRGAQPARLAVPRNQGAGRPPRR